jgi:hypothetical protein
VQMPMKMRKFSKVLSFIIMSNLIFCSIYPILNFNTMKTSGAPQINSIPVPSPPENSHFYSLGDNDAPNCIHGAGENLPVSLVGNASDSVSNSTPSEDLIIPTHDWNLTKINIIFSNISAIIQDEVETSTPIAGVEKLDELRAMQFTLSDDYYLEKFRVWFDIGVGKLSDNEDLDIYLYNATSSGLPDYYFYHELVDLDLYLVAPFSDWVEIPLATATLLSLSNTYNGTFYLVLAESEPPTGKKSEVNWGYLEDDSDPDLIDEGKDYYNLNGLDPEDVNWQTQDYDFTLSLTLKGKVNASDVNLTVNGLNAADLELGTGFWTSNEFHNTNPVSYDIDANLSISYDINWEAQLQNNTHSTSSFEARVNEDTIFWNIILAFPFPSGIIGDQMNFTIPLAWNMSSVLRDSQPYSDWFNITTAEHAVITVNNAINASWSLNCTDANYGSSITVEKLTLGSYEPLTQLVVNGSEILRINGTMKDTQGNDILIAQGNLTILDPFNTTEFTSSMGGVDGLVSFLPWQINTTVTMNGTHQVFVVWCNGTAVGVNSTFIEILPLPTDLTYIYNDPTAETGDPITAIVYFNETYDGNGIPDANFYLINNHTGDYFWEYSYAPLLAQGNYSITIETGSLTGGEYEFTIIANGSVYLPSHTNITFVIQGGTSFAWVAAGAHNISNLQGGYTLENGSYYYDCYSTSPENDPVWDDLSHQITVKYNDSWGNLIVVEDVNLIQIRWDGNLTSIFPTMVAPGYYNFTLDTTGLDVGTHFYTIVMQTSNYYRAYLNITVNIHSVATDLDLGEYITVSQYEYETLEFWVAYADLFHNTRIADPPASLTYNLSGITGVCVYKGSPSLAYQGLVDLSGLSVGVYNLTIYANGGPKYESNTKNITVNIISKSQANLLFVNLPSNPRIGELLSISASLTNLTNGAPLISEVLQVIVDFWDIGNVTIADAGLNKFLLTDGFGTVQTEKEVPEGAQYVNLTTVYEGTSEIAPNTIQTLLLINPKWGVNLTLLSLPDYILAGTEFEVYANLTLTEGTPLYDSPLYYDIRFQVGNETYQSQEVRLTNGTGIAELLIEANPLMESIQIQAAYRGNSTIQNSTTMSPLIPIVILNSSIILNALDEEIMVGKTIELTAILLINETPAINKTLTFTFTFEGHAGIDTRTSETDGTGTAHLSYEIPSGVSRVYISVAYDGQSYEYTSSTTDSIAVITVWDLILRYAPIWLSIVIGAVVVGLVFYVNKRMLHLSKFQKDIRKLKSQALTKGRIENAKYNTREEAVFELVEREIAFLEKAHFNGKNKLN